MNKKILAIIVSIAMLISALSVFTYAADVEIDLSDLFGPEETETEDTPKDDTTGGSTEDGKEDFTGDVTPPEDDTEDEEDEEDDNKGNTSSRPSSNKGNSSSNKGNSSSNKNDDKADEDEDKEANENNEDEEKTEEPKEWVNVFTDVKETDWYYDTVKYASENGIMNGVEDGVFAPNNTLTRAMLVTILYRVAGSPDVDADSKFSDVKNTDWYGAPIIWASENGVVNGITETEFAPNNAITREQIATIMYRYAKANEFDVSVGENTNILSYDDFDTISSYAIEAIQYTVGSGIMKGKTETTVNPLDNATRAEAATVVMRFIEGNK